MSVYSKLIAVQAKLKAPKSQYNSFGKYYYRNCEDIMEALKPLLSENGCTLFMQDDVTFIEGRFYVKAKAVFVDIETGETVEAVGMAREEDDKKGMDGSQITGAASSYARKYCLNGLFLIDDTKDSDYTNGMPAPTANAKKSAPAAKAKPAPAPAQTVEACMQCGKPIEAGGGMTSAQVAKARKDKYGMPLCQRCANVVKDRMQANAQAVAVVEQMAAEADLPFIIEE